MADVFISHSSKDKEIAEAICSSLEALGIKCWMAPRDIRGGEDWSAAITEAISRSKVFIVVYSKNSAQSTQVPREIALADSAHSHIIPYKVDDTELSASFKYYLTANHWVNANSGSDSMNIDGIVSAVNGALGSESAPNVTVNNVVINMAPINQYNSAEAPQAAQVQQAQPSVPFEAPPKKSAPRKKAMIFGISAAVLAVVSVAVVLAVVFSRGGGEPMASDDTQEASEGRKHDTSAVADIEEVSADDSAVILFSPGDIEPYENSGAKILSDDPNESFVVLGERHNTGILLNAYDASYIVYSNTDGYDKLRFTAARTDNTERGENTIRVFLDGKEQKAIEGNADFMPQEFEYDISGVGQIKIAMDENFNNRAVYALMDISFSKNGAEVPENTPEPSAAADIAYAPVDKLPYENKKAKLLANEMNETFVILRQSYNTGILFNAYDSSYVTFDNSEGYEQLSFTLGRIDNTARGENTFRVFLDGVEKKTISANADFMPQEYTFDISAVKQIKILMDENYNARAEYALMDICFTKNGAQPTKEIPEINAPDIAYAPADKPPYENKEAKLLENDPNNSFIVLQQVYDTGIVLNAYDSSYVLFDNNEGYEQLSFTLGRIDNTERGENNIRVFLDGVEQKNIVTNGEFMPQDYSYDISGVKQIKIAMAENYSVRAEYALMDICFTKNGAQPQREEEEITAPDTANVPVDKQPYDNKDAVILDNDPNGSFTILGQSYNSGIVLNAYDESKIIFHNREGYTKLSFAVSKIDDTADGENKIKVYIDRVEQKDILLNGGAALSEYEYDISGKSQIVIFVEQNYSSRAEIALVDMRFSK